MEPKNRRFGLSSSTLKMIAVVTMLIDHIAAVLLVKLLIQNGTWELNGVYQLMRDIGRIAFPIYCFLLVEGFMRTSNVKKYLGRMLLFAFIIHIACRRVEKHMVPDVAQQPKVVQQRDDGKTSDISTWKLFWSSGFVLMIIIAGLRMIISNSVQTLSATILMESYEYISPSIGNILNTLIIVSGIAGVMLVNWLFYPRLIRNEVMATLVLILLAIVPIGALLFLGRLNVAIVVISMCVAAIILTGAGLIMSHFSALFVKYGKNGLASGIYNSSAAIAIMIQNYGILSLAEHQGWKTVIWSWVIMLVVCVILTIIAYPLRKRFRY